VQESPAFFGMDARYMTISKLEKKDVGDTLDLNKKLDSFLQTEDNSEEQMRHH